MATPRRPGRPARPGSAGARRRPAEEEPVDEVQLDENGDPILEDLPPKGPPVTMIVGLAAALLFAVLLAILVFSKRGYLAEVENLSEDPLQKVSVKINGETHFLGDMRPNSVEGARVKCSPGSDVEVIYTVPNRGEFVKKLPKLSEDKQPSAPDFAEFKGRFRIRVKAEGIKETEY